MKNFVKGHGYVFRSYKETCDIIYNIVILFTDYESARDARVVLGDKWIVSDNEVILSQDHDNIKESLEQLKLYGDPKTDGSTFKLTIQVIPFEQLKFNY